MLKGFKVFALFVGLLAVAACGGGLGLNQDDDIVPVLNSITPNNAAVGSGAFDMQIVGSSMLAGVEVRWAGDPVPVTELDATHITAHVPAAKVAVAGAFDITLKNPNVDGISNAISFTVGNPNPVPTITSLDPANKAAGSGTFALRVLGTGFVAGGGGLTQSQVHWNGTVRSTLYVSSTELIATIPAADIAAAGTANVTVVNAAPGGGTSTASTFTIN